MIRYEKRRWSAHLLDIRGSMLLEIVRRVSACVLLSLLVVATHHYYRGLALPATGHTLVGAAIGLSLVFRTNASYDRYWEGRRQWGAIINEARNWGRMSRVYLNHGAPDLARRLGLWTMAFAHAVANRLRDGDGLGAAGDLLQPVETHAALATWNTPMAAAARMTKALAQARDRGVISDFLMGNVGRNIQQLVDAYGSCERIRKTPLPFV